MSHYKKNIMVGLTVLVALALFGWMIIRFSEATFRVFTKPQMPIQFLASGAEGISPGSPVLYLGVGVGRVSAVRRAEDQASVVIDAMVDRDPPLPANVEGRIRAQLIGGGSTITLTLIQPNGNSRTDTPPQPTGQLEPNQQLRARFVGVDLVPPELTDLTEDLTLTSQEVRAMIREFREAEVMANVNQTVTSLRLQIEKAGTMIDSINSLVADPQLHEDLSQTMANFRAASESATRIARNMEQISETAGSQIEELTAQGGRVLTTTQEQVEQVSAQLTVRMEEVSRVLANLEVASRRLSEGRGSAAMLINDPALYESLLSTSRELNLTVSGLRRLIEQWEQEGVPFRIR